MMKHPQTWLEAYDRAKEAKIVINSQLKKNVFNMFPNTPMETTPNPSSSYPVCIHKLSPEEMEKHQFLHLFYNCDERYFKGKKCKEHKLFRMDVYSHKYS
jgi:hypothetical protein